METGTIKKWLEKRGFGFIARDGAADAAEVFVHGSGGAFQPTIFVKS